MRTSEHSGLWANLSETPMPEQAGRLRAARGEHLMPLHIIDALTARYTGKDPGNAGTSSQPDRRQRRRTPVRWPLTLWRDGTDAVETVTANLSSSGFYCLSPMPLMPGDLVRCAL